MGIWGDDDDGDSELLRSEFGESGLLLLHELRLELELFLEDKNPKFDIMLDELKIWRTEEALKDGGKNLGELTDLGVEFGVDTGVDLGVDIGVDLGEFDKEEVDEDEEECLNLGCWYRKWEDVLEEKADLHVAHLALSSPSELVLSKVKFFSKVKGCTAVVGLLHLLEPREWFWLLCW